MNRGAALLEKAQFSDRAFITPVSVDVGERHAGLNENTTRREKPGSGGTFLGFSGFDDKRSAVCSRAYRRGDPFGGYRDPARETRMRQPGDTKVTRKNRRMGRIFPFRPRAPKGGCSLLERARSDVRTLPESTGGLPRESIKGWNTEPQDVATLSNPSNPSNPSPRPPSPFWGGGGVFSHACVGKGWNVEGGRCV